MYMVVDHEENTTLTVDDLPIGEDLLDVIASIETAESSERYIQWRDDLA